MKTIFENIVSYEQGVQMGKKQGKTKIFWPSPYL